MNILVQPIEGITEPQTTVIPVIPAIEASTEVEELITISQAVQPSINGTKRAASKLNLIEIDARTLDHAVELFNMFLSNVEIRVNEYVATNAMRFDAYLGRYKFNLKTAAWSYDSTDEEMYTVCGDVIDVMDNVKNNPKPHQAKSGTGVISYMAYMNDLTILESAAAAKEWLDNHHPSAQGASNTSLGGSREGINSVELHRLYGLNSLSLRPEDSVIFTSDEQSAYAVRFLMPYPSVATKKGADIDLVDFTPLKGRSIYIWADHDDAGRKYADSVSAALLRMDKKANVYKLKPLMYLPEWVVEQDDLFVEKPEGVSFRDVKPRDEALPSGYNASDALAEGWTSNLFCEVFFKLVQVVQFTFKVKKVGSFLVQRDGIYEIKYKDGVEVFNKISSLIEVTALTRDEQNKNWGMLLSFDDRDGHSHEWAMPKEMLANKDEYRQVLLSRGVDIYPSGITKLPEYFIEANTSKRALCVNTIGWHGDVFVLPEKSYGSSEERVILQTTNARKVSPYGISGTLLEWQHNIGAKCIGNSRIILAVCVSLTGPLLDALKLENGGFHFRGQSSTGKTKTLSVSASIFGGKAMVRVWRATGNAIESLAREHNDTVLLLDELGQVDPAEAGDIAYTLGNGQTKARSNVNGDAKETSTWRLLFISTGEIGLADHVAAGGGTVKAGQEIRMLDIPADAGAGYGVFENIHGATSAAVFADSLQTLSETFYGSPADALLTRLTEPGELERAVTFVRKVQGHFVQQYVSNDAHGQVTRAASRFGAVAGVGEYCISIGILPWEAGHAIWGVSKCYLAWLESRGDNTASEDIRALAQVREFIERNGESRFTLMQDGVEDNRGQRTINRAGFRLVKDDGSTEYWVLREMYQKEICHGVDPRLVTRVLKDKGYLEIDSAGKSSVSKLVPGLGRMRVYVIKASFMQSVGGEQQPQV